MHDLALRTPRFLSDLASSLTRPVPVRSELSRRRCPTVGDVHHFTSHDHEWTAFAERLKLIACPHCRRVGMLVRHGYLRGYDDTSPRRKTVRARRVFCSNRHRRTGCGRTFSVWMASKIRRLSLTTQCLLAFLQRAATGPLAAAIRDTACLRSDRTLRRIWNQFDRGQSRLRTALHGRAPPPRSLSPSARRPDAAQTLAHLHAAFPQADCPIAAFQQATGSFFL